MERDFDTPNRGMFGYEGEGFMRGRDYDDYARRGIDASTGFDYPREGPQGYRDLEADRGRPRQSHRGKGPKNYQRSDERIREEVCERLTMDHDVDASDVEVTIAESRVTLSGTVPDRHSKRLAEDIAESVVGVKDVDNQLRVAR